MKKKYLIILLFAFTFNAFSSDTTIVRIHDRTDMTWYGNYDEWGVLPDGSSDYQKIYLHYTMGCATGGCSDWDYTTQIFVRHRTGEIDSSLQSSPLFTVNGNILDSVMYSDSVYVHFWDFNTNSLDSSLSNLLEIIQFNDSLNPTSSTDTLYAFQSGFYNMIFDTLGNIIDSIYVLPNNIMMNSYYNWYQIFDVIENYELARVITPYGSMLSNNWEFTSIFDITDFAPILKDSVEIRCHYSGWSSGFSATLDFEFIKGTPPRDVIQINNVYNGGYSYVSSSDFENNKLTPQNIHIKQNSKAAMVKMTATGHGFDNSQYAAEFKPINYYLKIDGVQTHTQYNWDSKCGENPIYPQGGTWILDRANWCPGTRAETYGHEITTYINPGDSSEINIDFQPYTWNGTQTPSYIVQCQLFQYGNPNFINSVEIVDVIKPSLKDEHSRKNPICGKPLIKIRNYGSDILTSLEIRYRVVGGDIHNYNWIGNLAFLESEEIELPNLTSWYGSENVFEVELVNPNGKADDYNKNNKMLSPFENAPEYPDTFVLWFNTNNGVIGGVSESSWQFLDEENNIFLSSGQLPANSQFKDTLSFPSGCFTFYVQDTDEDGLSYWNNNDGNGIVRFREDGGPILKSFIADFGSHIIHQFTIDGVPTSINEKETMNWKIFPNPTNKNIHIEGFSKTNYDIVITDNLGKKISKYIDNPLGRISKTISLKEFSEGIYYLKIKNKNQEIYKKVVKQ
ncbi:MAG: hypothetical protein CMD14_01995 [Flavobacteriales bacterium]|nr:hypothetical protein [Flavobacteriales bacterium]|tara:strand:- start:1144 stop:3348 length:2205 start_codon:yes stop_codon:yes gene_type:complete